MTEAPRSGGTPAEPDAVIVARFIVGNWPGLEDGIAWGSDEVDGRHPVYEAAKRVLAGALSGVAPNDT